MRPVLTEGATLRIEWRELGAARCGTEPRLLLQDLSRGFVTYVLDGQVHSLRLADGADARIAPGTNAGFIDTGLVYSDGDRIRSSGSIDCRSLDVMGLSTTAAINVVPTRARRVGLSPTDRGVK